MKVISKATEYGLRALIYMASKDSRQHPITIGEISEALDISFHFLTKTFQNLTQQGILESTRGPAGGIRLNKPPQHILLIDLIYILEGRDFFDKCLLGLPGCGEKEPCPVHHFWKKVKTSLQQDFETTTLDTLAQGVRSGNIRL